VLLVGADFTQLLMDCVSRLNNHNDLHLDSAAAADVDDNDDDNRLALTDDGVSSESTGLDSVPTVANVLLTSITDHSSSDARHSDAGHCTAVDSNVSSLFDSRNSALAADDDDSENEVEISETVAESVGVGVAGRSAVWTTFLQHYVKLGETHAYICGFIKNR